MKFKFEASYFYPTTILRSWIEFSFFTQSCGVAIACHFRCTIWCTKCL